MLNSTGGKSREDAGERRRLLALVHIAAKDIGLGDDQYRGLLAALFKTSTAAALSNDELRKLVAYFMKEFNWRHKGSFAGKGSERSQIKALHLRLSGFISEIPNGQKRVGSLCRKICGVDRIEWCKDLGKLKRLLAVLGNIVRIESEKNSTLGTTVDH